MTTRKITRKEATDEQRINVTRFLSIAEKALLSAASVKVKPGVAVMTAPMLDKTLDMARKIKDQKSTMEDEFGSLDEIISDRMAGK